MTRCYYVNEDVESGILADAILETINKAFWLHRDKKKLYAVLKNGRAYLIKEIIRMNYNQRCVLSLAKKRFNLIFDYDTPSIARIA